MDFGVDKDKLDTLTTNLGTISEQIETDITTIFSQIDGIEGNGWSGEGYNEFKTGCHNYENALKQLPEVIRTFKDHLNNKVKNDTAETLLTEAESGKKAIEEA